MVYTIYINTNILQININTIHPHKHVSGLTCRYALVIVTEGSPSREFRENAMVFFLQEQIIIPINTRALKHYIEHTHKHYNTHRH